MNSKKPSCTVLVMAAGNGQRFGVDIPKQYALLGGLPVLRRTVQAFIEHPEISFVQVVIGEGHECLYESAMQGLALPPPIIGGQTRQESVLKGLLALKDNAPDIVLIHDGARPLVDAKTISDVIAALAESPAAIAAVPVVDTLWKESSGDCDTLVDRVHLWRAQTPQGFHYGEILEAHLKMVGQNLTDDAAIARAIGLSVKLVQGFAGNIKITTPEDFEFAEAFLNFRQRKMGSKLSYGL